jgi:hydroxypyruvate reductase
MDHVKLELPAHEYLLSLFDQSLKAVDPMSILSPYLNLNISGQLVVVGAGKAAASMALAVEERFGNRAKGAVVTQYGYGASLKHIKLIEASHPLSDQKSIEASKQLINLIKDLNEDDLVLALISGGGSSLLSLPASNISLKEKKGICKDLLLCGATIQEINTVRKHLSLIKGGRLAKYAEPAQVISLIISDVPGDEASMVASGPTLQDNTSSRDAINILNYYNIQISKKVKAWLQSEESESPQLISRNLDKESHHIVASAKDMLERASQITSGNGLHTILLGDDINIDAEELGRQHAQLIENNDYKKPYILLSGGETSVKVKGAGKGGRNAHYLLGLIHHLSDVSNIFGLACDTDGKDGSEDNAGALFTPQIVEKAKELKLDSQQYLLTNDSFSYFKKIGGIVNTGPTYTNVNDFRAILVM